MNTALPAPLVEGFDLYTSNNRHRAIQSLRKIAAALMMSVGLHAVSLIGAEPDTVYLAKAEAFIIEEDVGDPGLSAGDRVTWQSETQGAAAGLVFGEDALLTAGAALHAVPSGGTIRIARGHYPISETLLIEQDVTWIGDGAQATYISGNREHRIVDVPGGHLVNFRHLTLTGGLSPADDPGGDAVRIGANAHVTFGFCEITDSGGESVVFAAGKLRFLNGAIRNNHGTAIRADATTAGRVWFDNSTMAGNQATGTAAGIQFTGGQVWARNSSIVLNTSTAGSPAGGIVKIGSGQLHLRNTVVAGNTVDGVLADISGAVYNSSYIRYSLIGDAATSGGIPHGAHGTIVGIDGEGTIPYEDLLHPPALLYGGSTVTVAPVPGSPLVGAGSNSLLPPDAVDIDGDGNTSEAIPFDQRGAGYPRLLGATVSIGAVEGAFTAPAIHEEKGPMLGDVRGVADGVLFLYLPPPGNLGEIKVIASEAG